MSLSKYDKNSEGEDAEDGGNREANKTPLLVIQNRVRVIVVYIRIKNPTGTQRLPNNVGIYNQLFCAKAAPEEEEEYSALYTPPQSLSGSS